MIARLGHLAVAGLVHVADKTVQMIGQFRIGVVAMLHGGARQEIRPHGSRSVE